MKISCLFWWLHILIYFLSTDSFRILPGFTSLICLQPFPDIFHRPRYSLLWSREKCDLMLWTYRDWRPKFLRFWFSFFYLRVSALFCGSKNHSSISNHLLSCSGVFVLSLMVWSLKKGWVTSYQECCKESLSIQCVFVLGNF